MMMKKASKIFYRLYLTAVNLLAIVCTVKIVLCNEHDGDRLIGILALISGLVLLAVVDTLAVVKAER